MASEKLLPGAGMFKCPRRLVLALILLSPLTLGLLLTASGAWANTITSVIGTVTHGNSITIAGTTFGTKGGSNANKPLLWADFESSINPTSLGVITAWNVTQNLTRSASAPQYGLSTNNVVGTFGTSSSFQIEPAGGVTTLYVYGKRRYSASSPSSNQKFFRIWNDNGGDTVASTSNAGIILDENCIPSGRFQAVTFPVNAWNQDEFLWRQSTAGTCSGTTSSGNGYYEFIQNGVRKQSFINNFPTEISAVYGSPASNGIRVIDNFTDIGDINGTSVYMDDLYVDNTFARVMIGNASTFAASTTREVQIPTAWSTSTITVQVNRGSFGASASAWLYVIDSTNTPSAGFPITFGGGTSDTTPPVAPVNLRIQ